MVDGLSFFSFGMLAGIVFTIIFILGLKILNDNDIHNEMDRGKDKDNKE